MLLKTLQLGDLHAAEALRQDLAAQILQPFGYRTHLFHSFTAASAVQ
jgi:hypothetical protein